MRGMIAIVWSLFKSRQDATKASKPLSLALASIYLGWFCLTDRKSWQWSPVEHRPPSGLALTEIMYSVHGVLILILSGSAPT